MDTAKEMKFIKNQLLLYICYYSTYSLSLLYKNEENTCCFSNFFNMDCAYAFFGV